MDNQVIIVGGGLAGLTAAIHLSKIGIPVLLVEKQDYPKHKVCGEYVSNEVSDYLQWLGVDLSGFDPAQITRAEFSTTNGKTLNSELPLGGFGISRYSLDHYLYKKAISNGCRIEKSTVTDIQFLNEQFTVTLNNERYLHAPLVLGAFGKRSNIDQKLQREFAQKKSPWLAVKSHFRGDFPNDLVGLHNFEGGYCGVSQIEDKYVNVCYLTRVESFKKFRNIEQFQREVLCQNPQLEKVFSQMTPVFEQPLTISQVSFEKKLPVENHVLMIGDSAGLIHPLCGNGMAMAIHSAKIACELLPDFLQGRLLRGKLEQEYSRIWNKNFKKRLRTGRILASALQQRSLSQILIRTLIVFPSLLPGLIKMTHGKPITTAA